MIKMAERPRIGLEAVLGVDVALFAPSPEAVEVAAADIKVGRTEPEMVLSLSEMQEVETVKYAGLSTNELKASNFPLGSLTEATLTGTYKGLGYTLRITTEKYGPSITIEAEQGTSLRKAKRQLRKVALDLREKTGGLFYVSPREEVIQQTEQGTLQVSIDLIAEESKKTANTQTWEALDDKRAWQKQYEQWNQLPEKRVRRPHTRYVARLVTQSLEEAYAADELTRDEFTAAKALFQREQGRRTLQRANGITYESTRPRPVMVVNDKSLSGLMKHLVKVGFDDVQHASSTYVVTRDQIKDSAFVADKIVEGYRPII